MLKLSMSVASSDPGALILLISPFETI